MKYQLETSPVWDVYREGVECPPEGGKCPLCVLHARAERHYVEFFLGNSVMVPEMRAQVNKTGFCPHHTSLLLEGDNRLGLALMTHTHLLELTEKLRKLHGGLKKRAERILSSTGPLFSRKRAGSLVKELESAAAFAEKQQGECLICSRLESTAKRHAYTILYLWERDEAYQRELRGSKGFCLPHLGFVGRMAAEVFSARKLSRWLLEIIPLEEKNLEELAGGVHGFTQRFDYQRGEESGKSHKNALPRALQMMTGKVMYREKIERGQNRRRGAGRDLKSGSGPNITNNPEPKR